MGRSEALGGKGTVIAMAITQETVVINDFGGATVEARTRTTSSGTKTRYTTTIKAEPIAFNFAGVDLGRATAEAIRDALKRSIKNIGAFASLATRERRERAARAMNTPGGTAHRRYSGGRTGVTPPHQTDRMFNDSGRLADNLEVRQTGEGGDWIVNVTANRLDPSTFTPAAFDAMLRRLVELAPAWGGGKALLEDPEVVKAIKKGLDANVAKLADARGRISSAWMRLAQQAYGQLLKPILLG